MFNPESPPELSVAQWFNATEPLLLGGLKGKVVILVAFHMRCSGSLKHALPQAQRLARTFNSKEVAIIGLHMEFEDHKNMKAGLLEPFIKQEQISIPIAVDAPNGGGLPKTMDAYGMQGTPTLLLFDRQGRLRRHYLGAADDVRISAEIMALALEPPNAPREVSMAIEQQLASALIDPTGHEHEHSADCCGAHHDHGQDHDHTREQGRGCCDKH